MALSHLRIQHGPSERSRHSGASDSGPGLALGSSAPALCSLGLCTCPPSLPSACWGTGPVGCRLPTPWWVCASSCVTRSLLLLTAPSCWGPRAPCFTLVGSPGLARGAFLILTRLPRLLAAFSDREEQSLVRYTIWLKRSLFQKAKEVLSPFPFIVQFPCEGWCPVVCIQDRGIGLVSLLLAGARGVSLSLCLSLCLSKHHHRLSGLILDVKCVCIPGADTIPLDVQTVAFSGDGVWAPLVSQPLSV